MKKLSKELRKVIEQKGWKINEYDNEIDICQYSPLGEDFFFTVSKENARQEIIDYAFEFDPEEHAELYIGMRGTHGIPNSIRDLMDDADAIAEMLDELSEAVA